MSLTFLVCSALHVQQPLQLQRARAPPAAITMQQDDNYDLSQQGFDLLELRTFRRDALLQYAVSQRSQQLRILFYASSAVVSATFPWLFEQLIPSAANFDLPTIAACELGGLFFGALAANEKSLRGKVLLRMDRELSLAGFSIWQPGSAVGGTQKRQLSTLRDRRRVVVMAGPPAMLLGELKRAAIYRRRLEQSGIALVFVAAEEDASGGDDAAWADAARKAEAEGWLWQPTDAAAWRSYFDELLSNRASPVSVGTECAWFALSLKGRSCASGVGALAWDELLGTKLPPLRSLLPSEPSATPNGGEEAAVLLAQSDLYAALAKADHAAVAALFAAEDDGEVTELAANGRLDGWETVLKYDATVGLQVASQDVYVSGDEAWSTALEFPAGGGGASLLCTQRWAKSELQLGGEGAADHDDSSTTTWRLVQHRTIPYTEDVDAAACLRCDHRGCVALQRQGPQGAAGMPGDGRA